MTLRTVTTPASSTREAIILLTRTAAPQVPLGIRATQTTQAIIKACSAQAKAIFERPADSRLQKKTGQVGEHWRGTDKRQRKRFDFVDFRRDNADYPAFQQHERGGHCELGRPLGAKAALYWRRQAQIRPRHGRSS